MGEQELKILELSKKALQLPEIELDLIRSEAVAMGIEGPSFDEYLKVINKNGN